MSKRIACVLPPLALMLLAGCSSSSVTDIFVTSDPPTPGQISGRYIAVIGDADMQAEAFADGRLRSRSGAKDTLTLIALPIAEEGQKSKWQTPFTQIEVSNSVMGPPCALAVSPDGTLAFVVETKGHAPAGATRVSDLPDGNSVTSIVVGPGIQTQVASAAEVGKRPSSVDVHPQGDLIAVTTAVPGEQLVVVPVDKQGKFAKGLAWELLGIDDRAATASSVSWSPNGRYVAVVLPMRDEVVFYEFTRTLNGGGMGFARYGKPVKVGKHPFMGKFSPDGKFFVVNELHWGDQVEGYLVGAPAGSVSVIRMSDVPSQVIIPEGQPEPTVSHEVVSSVQVGISPEGLAVSPDGRWVVTANLRRSMLPTGDARLTPGGSVSLLSLDGLSGALTNHGEFPIGAMPEGIGFDATGRHVIVTQFRSFDPASVDGELAFFKLVPGGGLGGDAPRLVPSQYFVGVGIGPHGVVIVR